MCASCEWEDYIETMDEMLLDEKYEFAADTIDGIQHWVSQNEHITENQKNAINNIYYSKE